MDRLTIPWADQHSAAILHGRVPGDGGAQAIDVLTGGAHQGGNLSISARHHVGQASLTRPAMALPGLARVGLMPGESRPVSV